MGGMGMFIILLFSLSATSAFPAQYLKSATTKGSYKIGDLRDASNLSNNDLSMAVSVESVKQHGVAVKSEISGNGRPKDTSVATTVAYENNDGSIKGSATFDGPTGLDDQTFTASVARSPVKLKATVSSDAEGRGDATVSYEPKSFPGIKAEVSLPTSDYRKGATTVSYEPKSLPLLEKAEVSIPNDLSPTNTSGTAGRLSFKVSDIPYVNTLIDAVSLTVKKGSSFFFPTLVVKTKKLSTTKLGTELGADLELQFDGGPRVDTRSATVPTFGVKTSATVSTYATKEFAESEAPKAKKEEVIDQLGYQFRSILATFRVIPIGRFKFR